jgi:hypothetical protein
LLKEMMCVFGIMAVVGLRASALEKDTAYSVVEISWRCRRKSKITPKTSTDIKYAGCETLGPGCKCRISLGRIEKER